MTVLKEYQTKVRELLKLVDEMRATGAQLSMELPTIAVCGNQSAGKSSLLEAICDVPLPRQSGTCTRCPMELRLTEDGEWCARLRLRREWDESAGVEQARLLDTPQETAFGRQVTDKTCLECAVRAAQRALLNPGKPTAQFEAMTSGDDDAEEPSGADELQFTKNVVVVQIRGAPVNLTLIDLPGIIQSTGDTATQGYVGLIKDLVLAYIKRERTIIVAAISCKDDFNNQAIVDLSRKVDPMGGRTLGVLTKPDTIESGTHQQWVDVLCGRQAPLRLGYYVVKNPSQVELEANEAGLARARETEFFASNAPWKDDHLQAQRHRFGVPSLSRELSKQLVALTDRELPGMRAEVERLLQGVKAELKPLPPPLGTNLQAELLKLLERLRKLMSPHEPQQREVYALFKGFSHRVTTTRPRFILHTLEGEEGEEGDEGDEGEEGEEAIHTDMLEGLWTPEEEAAIRSQEEEDECAAPALTVDDVQELIASYRSYELPNCNPYAALEGLIAKFQGMWEQHAMDLLQNVSDLQRKIVDKHVSAVFGAFPAAVGRVKGAAHRLEQELREAMQARLTEFLLVEAAPPYTLNAHYFEDVKRKTFDQLRQAYYPRRELDDDVWYDLSASLAAAGYQIKAPAELCRLRNGRADPTLDHMAACLAYFKVASKRFVDYVAMFMLQFYVARFREQLLPMLTGLLLGSGYDEGDGDDGGGGSPRERVPLAHLLAEEPDMANTRHHLQSRLTLLRRVHKLLMA